MLGYKVENVSWGGCGWPFSFFIIMSDYCIKCGVELNDQYATYSEYFNAWLCPKCGFLNPNCNGEDTIPELFEKAKKDIDFYFNESLGDTNENKNND